MMNRRSSRQSLSDEERSLLKIKGMAFLNEFRKVQPTMRLLHAFSFLLVALNEGLGITEYAELADVSQVVMTRYLLDLGERNHPHELGSGLVMPGKDPMGKHQTFLTPKGRALAKRLVAALR